MNALSNEKLVAPAERPEFEEDVYPNESKETVWQNPTDRDCILDLYVGATYGRAPRTWEEKTGCRKFRIKAGDTRAISDEFDQAIQQTSCNHPRCASKKRSCRDTSHSGHWDIIGGFGPYLLRLGVQTLPRLHPALDAAHAERRAANQRALQAAEMAEAAKEQARVATGEAILARQESDARTRELAAREAAIAAKERELGMSPAEPKAAAKKQQQDPSTKV